MSADPMTKQEYNRIMCRMYHLPSQLERARRRVKQLEAQCIRYGMKDLLEDPKHASDAFEREFQRAKREDEES